MTRATPHHMFVGPTRARALEDQRSVPGTSVHGPARRGSILGITSIEQGPGTITIVDGTFHSFPAVGHKEIVHAIESGWEVWGLSSMGAIRAAELHTHGMHGFGRVYGRYAQDPDFSDDEVTVVHSSDPPHTLLSEPMIHLRAYLEALQASNLIPDELAISVTAALKNRWYGERTLTDMRQLLLCAQPGLQPSVDGDIRDFSRWRVKDHDLADYLESRPWESERRT